MDKLASKDRMLVRHNFLPYSHQWIDNEDINLVVKELPLGKRDFFMKGIRNFGIGADTESIHRFTKLDYVE